MSTGTHVGPVLAQRAASEGPRWTRAVEDQSAPIPEEETSKLGKSMYIVRCLESRATLATPLLNTTGRERKRLAWRFPVLAQRAVSEDPRCTRARWEMTDQPSHC